MSVDKDAPSAEISVCQRDFWTLRYLLSKGVLEYLALGCMISFNLRHYKDLEVSWPDIILLTFMLIVYGASTAVPFVVNWSEKDMETYRKYVARRQLPSLLLQLINLYNVWTHHSIRYLMAGSVDSQNRLLKLSNETFVNIDTF